MERERLEFLKLQVLPPPFSLAHINSLSLSSPPSLSCSFSLLPSLSLSCSLSLALSLSLSLARSVSVPFSAQVASTSHTFSHDTFREAIE